MPRMSVVDAAWYRMDAARSVADIAGMLEFDGELEESRIREVLERRLLSRPRFRQRVVSVGHTLTWEEEDSPSLDRHFSCRRLEHPGGPAELNAAVNTLLNEPFDFALSPWRIWLLHGAATGSVLFIQIHHCMGDGFALVDVLLSLADAPVTMPKPHSAAPQATALWSNPLQLARRAPRVLSDLLYLLRLPFDSESRLHIRLSGQRRVAWSSSLELSRVQALAHARHATVNDVLMAVLSGGLQRYCRTHEVAPETVRALVPVNMRPPNEGIDAEHGNWFGLVYVTLPLVAANPEARLERVKRAVDEIKASEQALVSLGVLAMLGILPEPLKRLAQYLFARKASLVVSNVPGPREPFQLAGRTVRDAMFWVPHPGGLACGVSLLSYAGQIRIGVRSDVAAIADPERLAACVERELVEWEDAETQAAQARPTPAAQAAAPSR